MKRIFIFLFFAFIGLSNINGATFTSVSSGTWSTPATWSIVGADADGIPDQDDDVTISAGHTISLSLVTNNVRTFTNNGTLTGNLKRFNVFGNFTNNNVVSYGSVVLYIQASCIFTSTSPFSGAASWWINGNLTISSGTIINFLNSTTIYASKTVTNFGTVLMNGSGAISLGAGANWINGANSYLRVRANFSGTGNLIATGTGNTVEYANTSTQIKAANYYNLLITAAGTTTRTATGNIVVANNFSIAVAASNPVSLGGFNLTVGGNWSNLASSTILNQGTITFSTSANQTITRTSGNEIINNMVVSGTGTTSLARSLTIGNLTINNGTLDVSASNFDINISGNLTNNSSINTRQGLFNFNGVASQQISGSSITNFHNVTSTNAAGVSVNSTIIISNILRVNAGSFGTNGSGIITIPATGPTTYGRIASVGGSLTGTGWIVESYIDGPAPKGWQWLSSPINGNILKDWDDDTRFYMSGVGGNDGSAGSFKSVRTYDEAINDYTNITTINTALTPGKGFHVWMADNSTTGLVAPLVYNSIGTPNYGTINFPVTEGGAGGGYNLVGNPYACPITYSTVVAASGNLYSSFVILLEDDSYSYDANGGIIAPNQGFMCVADASGNIVFTEAAKNIVSNPNILKTAAKNDVITFSVYNNINGISGRTNIEFSNNVTDNFEKGKDLYFLASPSDEADNIYTKSTDNIPLLKNMLMNNGEDKRVPLTVKSGVYGSHFISTKGLTNLSLYNSVWLEDLTTGNKVDLLKNQEYAFNADEIGKDYEFVIHFSTKKQNATNGSAIINSLNENTSVYNTPSNVIVKFDMQESTSVTISVYNLAGQKVTELSNLNVKNDRIPLPLQKENGLYLLIIQSGDQQITRKIIY